MEFLELRRELLKSMNQIAIEMEEIILFDYFDKLGNDKKRLLSIMQDAYKTLDLFCIALQKGAIIQAGLLLRQFLEQVAISFALAQHQDLIPKYNEHCKFRIETANLKKGEQIAEASKKYGIPENRDALAFIDYGWIPFDNPKNCGEDGMLKYVGFDDIITWRKLYLDKLAHTSYTSNDLLGETHDFPIVNNFVQIAGKLFDHLCVAFHNLTKYAFVIDGKDMFNNVFRPLYSSYCDELNK